MQAESRRRNEEARSRRLIFEYEPYGYVRTDFRRMVVELAFTWLIAIGFTLAVKAPKQPKRD